MSPPVCPEEKLYYVGAKKKKEEKREVVIEAERKRQIFLDCHLSDLGHHLGQKKTVHRIQSSFYWLGIIRDVVDWVLVLTGLLHLLLLLTLLHFLKLHLRFSPPRC